MFTGIVEETGRVLDVEETTDGRRLRIETSFAGLEAGQSVSVSGACLTVEDAADTAEGTTWFGVFLATETLERTYLGQLAVGDAVNLERAMPANGRFDGHIVQGHVDATAEVLAVESVGEDWEYTVSLPPAVSDYLVEKGSVAVDGISLTVADRAADRFRVAVIPETHALTTLSEVEPGDPVHLEVDVVAKYVERLLED